MISILKALRTIKIQEKRMEKYDPLTLMRIKNAREQGLHIDTSDPDEKSEVREDFQYSIGEINRLSIPRVERVDVTLAG